MASAHAADRKALTKKKELIIHQFLRENCIPFDYQVHVPFAGCGIGAETTCAYIDFVIYAPWGVICLEVDEFQHKSYDPKCDPRRELDIYGSALLGSNGMKMVFVRYNPDPFTVGGVTMRVSSKDRQSKLLELLQDMSEPAGFLRYVLFFDKDSAEDALPSVSVNWDPRTREVTSALSSH